MTERTRIAALPDGSPRPFWSVMIPSLDPDPEHLEEALRSVLAQDPGPAQMQIALVDGGSQHGDPATLATRIGGARVQVERRERCDGMADNWNACLAHATGRWVHLLHQDDRVQPGFYAALQSGIEQVPGLGAAFCRCEVIGDDGARKRFAGTGASAPGLLEDWVEHVFVKLAIQTPAIVVRRACYETLGGFDADFSYALDWDMWKRVAARYPIWYEARALAVYREHRASTSAALQRSARNVAEIRRSIEVANAYLPAGLAGPVSKRARAAYTDVAMDAALRLAGRERDFAACFAQLREAQQLASTGAVLGSLLRCSARAARLRLWPGGADA